MFEIHDFIQRSNVDRQYINMWDCKWTFRTLNDLTSRNVTTLGKDETHILWEGEGFFYLERKQFFVCAYY